MQKTPRSPPGCGRSQRRSFRRSKDGASARRGANCVLNSLCLNCAYRGASSTKGSYLMMTEKQVVIIGGSEGIGLAVAKAARTLGARVLAVSRTREKLEAARDAVSGLEIRVADINNTASIQELFSELPIVDHVYIAAGSTKIGGPLDHPINEFRHKFDERLWG